MLYAVRIATQAGELDHLEVEELNKRLLSDCEAAIEGLCETSEHLRVAAEAVLSRPRRPTSPIAMASPSA
jgi:hypothetical protein